MSASRQQCARDFAACWTARRGSEKGEDQQFWNMLLRDVLGVADCERHIRYQVPVPMRGTTKFLDAWIPETRVLIEHKSRGVNLDAPQPGHGGLTPYEQAAEYDNARAFDEKARWIVTCNFDEFRIYDRAKPLAPPLALKLANLPKEAYRLEFLVNPKEKAIDRELEISVQAGRIVGEIYDALLKQYQSSRLLTCGGGKPEGTAPESEVLAALNRLCVRLVFCLYAEDAGIFPKDCFRRLMENTPAPFLRERLKKLFEVLDTPRDRRDPYLEAELSVFPYTNGGLFKFRQCENAGDIPPVTEDIRRLLVGASRFDWRDITPTVFGALFESTLNPATRRAGGMVYTSVENIHKVIGPLFLDDLARRVNECIALPPSPSRNKRLLAVRDEMAALSFLDPACGSGNFLTESYICLRRLENRIITALQQGQGELDLGTSVKVSVAQFHGIEINDFAAAVAKTALWIAEAQMLQETAEILHREPDFLPLKDYASIVEGNALRMDWLGLLTSDAGRQELQKSDVSSPKSFSFIMGNPPFVGARNKSKEQAADMEAVFGAKWQGIGNLDYVTAWYKKALDCILATKNTKATKIAFVSTNSICQGDGVSSLWKPLFAQGLEIDFAHRTFRWDNEAFDKAHVHCVIVGFHAGTENGQETIDARRENETSDGETKSLSSQTSTSRLTSRVPRQKTIFDGDRIIHAAHINGYLMDAPDTWIESRSKPLCDVPPLVFGSMPNDGGFLSDWSDADKAAVVKKYPAAEALFRPLLGSVEFINGKSRWCLWLKGASPAVIRSVPPAMEAVERVREMRLASKREATRKLAATPTLFGEIRQPEEGNYLLVPKVSSERRKYVPMGFFTSETICSDLVFLVPTATLYHFGVLTSSVHMAWMRAVAGRLEMRYRYSANIVYNNFPWPGGVNVANVKILPMANTNSQLETGNIGTGNNSTLATISRTAQAILDARAAHPGCSLADLYDPLTMPPDLRAAHEANDRAVLAAYGLAAGTPEPEIAAHLFRLFREMAKLYTSTATDTNGKIP